MQEVGQTEKVEIKVEDGTYLRNALEQICLSKAFDLMGHSEKCYQKALKAFKTVD